MPDTQIYKPNAGKERFFGKYKVVRELGRGAMGIVYECFDPDFERTIAVKIISPEILRHDTSGEYRQRFRNEMKAVGRLAHPNVISVFDAGDQDGVPYYVMEYVDGIELKQVIDDGQRFQQAEVVRIMKEVLSGLKYIHANNTVHRDLKPANIFLTREGAAKITDFGIAKLESSELTRVGTIIGSPRYMSPEQCQGLPVDARSDLFTAGIIFYQLLTNEHCFDANSPTAIMQKIIHSDPEAPSVLIPTLNKAFDKVILKALEKSPDRRFQNAEDFIEAIDDAVAGKKIKSVSSDRERSPVILAMVVIVAISLGAAVVYFIPRVIDFYGSLSILQTGPDPTTKQDEKNSAIPSDNKLATDRISSESEGAEIRQNQNTQGPGLGVESTQPDPSVSKISKKNLDKLRRVLIVAEMHTLQGRLVAPSGSNAYDAYKIVLEIDPENQKAKAGLQGLEGLLIEKINQFVAEGENSLAAVEAKNGARMFPKNQALMQLSENL